MAFSSDEQEYEDAIRVVSPLGSQKTTLLDIVEERNRALNKKNIIMRLFYISLLHENAVNRQDIGATYEKFFRTIQNSQQSDMVTGLMLIYAQHIVHVIEGSAEMLTLVMKDLLQRQQNPENAIIKSKILIVSQDIVQRLFTVWYYRVLDIATTGMLTYEPPDVIKDLILDIITQLLNLGDFLSKQPKLNIKATLDTLHDKVPHLLPQQGALHYLLTETNELMILPEDYVRMYTEPYDVQMMEDETWPLPTKLFPYS